MCQKVHTINRCIINAEHKQLNYVKSKASPHVLLRLPFRCSVYAWIIMRCDGGGDGGGDDGVCAIRQFDLNSIDFKWNENLTRTERRWRERASAIGLSWRFRCTSNQQSSSWLEQIPHICFHFNLNESNCRISNHDCNVCTQYCRALRVSRCNE